MWCHYCNHKDDREWQNCPVCGRANFEILLRPDPLGRQLIDLGRGVAIAVVLFAVLGGALMLVASLR